MKISELSRALSCFDENLLVVIEDENWPHCETKDIATVKFDGKRCVIETKPPEE